MRPRSILAPPTRPHGRGGYFIARTTFCDLIAALPVQAQPVLAELAITPGSVAFFVHDIFYAPHTLDKNSKFGINVLALPVSLFRMTLRQGAYLRVLDREGALGFSFLSSS